MECAAAAENGLVAPRKVKPRIIMWSSCSAPRCSPRRTKSRDSGIWTPVLIATAFTTAQRQKQPRCPSPDEWMNETETVHTEPWNSATKKAWNSDTCYNMDGPWKRDNISQTQKDNSLLKLLLKCRVDWDFPAGPVVKTLPLQGAWVQSLGPT